MDTSTLFFTADHVAVTRYRKGEEATNFCHPACLKIAVKGIVVILWQVGIFNIIFKFLFFLYLLFMRAFLIFKEL